jgi:hypothetical protein
LADFEKIILTGILRAVNESYLLRDEKFGFRPRHSKMQQLASLVEMAYISLDERRLTGTVFLGMA